MAFFTTSSYSRNLGEALPHLQPPCAFSIGPWRRPISVKMVEASAGEAGAALTSTQYEEGELKRPRWAGETPMSRLVAALISFKPLYSLMKLGARQVFISTAEKANVPWRKMAEEILQSNVYKEMDSIENQSLVYPDYYLKPFHAYDEGNLCWLAAAEAEAATLSMEKRAIPEATTVEDATEIVRGNWLQEIEQHHKQYSGTTTVKDILDIGCSVGVSTRFLADKFPSAEVTVHECPARATKNILKEAFRLLRPGATFTLIDNSPKSKVLQNLSPVLFTLMKSTEPFLDEYYLLDLKAEMRKVGFEYVNETLTDPTQNCHKNSSQADIVGSSSCYFASLSFYCE